MYDHVPPPTAAQTGLQHRYTIATAARNTLRRGNLQAATGLLIPQRGAGRVAERRRPLSNTNTPCVRPVSPSAAARATREGQPFRRQSAGSFY